MRFLRINQLTMSFLILLVLLIHYIIPPLCDDSIISYLFRSILFFILSIVIIEFYNFLIHKLVAGRVILQIDNRVLIIIQVSILLLIRVLTSFIFPSESSLILILFSGGLIGIMHGEIASTMSSRNMSRQIKYTLIFTFISLIFTIISHQAEDFIQITDRGPRFCPFQTYE